MAAGGVQQRNNYLPMLYIGTKTLRQRWQKVNMEHTEKESDVYTKV